MSTETPSEPTPASRAENASALFAENLRQLPGATHPAGSVTNLLIAANVIAFVVLAGVFGAGWFDVADMQPYIGFAASNAAATTDGEWWRLLSSMFAHYGLLHLALNMWALYQTGHLMERVMGRGLYALTYLASGLGGGLLSMAWHGDTVWSAGASGAIFGVYGALLGFILREKQALPGEVFQPLLKSSLTFAGYNLIYGFIHPGIDNAAHIGGIAAGLLFGWLCALPMNAAQRAPLVKGRYATGTVALVVMVAVGVLAAPRFDYRVREELAWQDAVEDINTKEDALLKRENAAMKAWNEDRSKGAELATLLLTDLAPFYRDFGARLRALSYTPGRRTERRRQLLVELVDLKVVEYTTLAKAARDDDEESLKRHDAVVQEIRSRQEAIAKLNN
jgi:rhomboid protease GluP